MTATVFKAPAEAEELATTTRRLLEREWVGRLGMDEAPGDALAHVWRKGLELGWLDLLDVGSDWLHYALPLLDELGRATCPLPLIDGLLFRLIAGDQATAVAPVLGLGVDGDVPRVADAGAGRLTGRIDHIETAGVATHLLVPRGDLNWVLIPLTADGVTLAPEPGLPQPAWSSVHLDGVEAIALRSTTAFADVIQLARFGAAARAQGSARRLATLAHEHARQRTQFGRRIGTFQAVAHRAADIEVALDSAALLLEQTARTFATGNDAWSDVAAAAVQRVGSTARWVTRAAHLTLGGSGFFEEHEAPAHFRRVHADVLRWGGPRAFDSEVGRRALDGPAVLPAVDPLGVDPSVRTQIRAFVKDWSESGNTLSYGHRVDRRFSQALGAAGWIGASWPPAHGGQGRSIREQLAVLEELAYAGAPIDHHLVAEWLIGPTIMSAGSESQRRELIPRILAGDLQICIGYSEPDAGSDLSALRTKARRDGDDFVINGAKIFTSFADTADICMVAARTEETSDPRRGLTLFLVPLTTPGVTVQRKVSFGGHPACNVYYDEVRVPGSAVLGTVDGAWELIIRSFVHERLVMGSYVYDLRHALEELVTQLRLRAEQGGEPIASFQREIGQLSAAVQAAGLFVIRCVEDLEAADPRPEHAAMAKVFTAELGEFLAEVASELLGPQTLLAPGPEAMAGGLFEWWQRDSLLNAIAGGTKDIQRNAIVAKRLRFPR